MTKARKMKLGLLPAGNGTYAGGWRLPDAQAGASLDVNFWKTLAKAAEQAKIHFIFWNDGIAVRSSAKNHQALSYESRHDVFEPLTLIAALSSVTEKIGFIATASTTYNEPYHIARKLASLDHISGGRVGWNVVTSYTDNEAKNFGLEQHVEHGTRYHRAEEFVDVVFGLWDSWEDDAFIRDKATGQYFDPDKLHVLDHRGEIFNVRGPLNVPRPVQGYPVIAQAGLSGPGRRLGTRVGEVIYTQQANLEEAKAYYKDLKSELPKFGRSPDSMSILPAFTLIIGKTNQEAQDKLARLQEAAHPKVGLTSLLSFYGELSENDLDEPLPPISKDHKHAADLEAHIGGRNLTVRQLYEELAGSGNPRIYRVAGTVQTIADEMENWFLNYGCDGFNLTASYFPGALYEIFDHLVPELQRRGLFQTEYEGVTLRDHLGLDRPPNRHTKREGAGNV